MGRWEDNAVGRLQDAAMELYRDPGYDQVTVAEIAERAGLTRRTFFRYFADKREVLFYGAEKLEAFFAASVLAAPEGAPALEVVGAALAAVARASDEDAAFAEFARARHKLIRRYAELRERELAKLAAMAAAAAGALRQRGVGEPGASLAGEAGVAAFKVGFERWVDDRKGRKLGHHVREAVRGLGVLGSEVAGREGKR